MRPYRPPTTSIRPAGHSPRDNPRSAEVFRARGTRNGRVVVGAPGVTLPPRSSGIVHISASQLKTASLCMRKWWFEKLAGVRPGAKYHFHFGKVLHGYLERYQLRQPLEPAGWDVGLQEGHAVWVRQRAEESIRQGLVRAVTHNVHIEYQLSALIGDQWVDRRGLPLLGVARAQVGADGERRALPPQQFYAPGGLLHTDIDIPKDAFDLGYFTGFMDGLDLTPEHPGVFDHKTAKNRTYAKSPAKLVVDEQMLSYAAVLLAMPGFEEQQAVYLRHNVFLKDPEVSLEESVYGVDATVQVDAVAAHWKWVITTAKEMKRWRGVQVGVGVERAAAYEQVPSALQVMGFEKGKKEACECYGGCPYKKACLGYSSVQTVTAELDYELRSVDQYGNDPRKRSAPAYVEKVFSLNKAKRQPTPNALTNANAAPNALTNANAAPNALTNAAPNALTNAAREKETCVVDTTTYAKSPSKTHQPRNPTMPFNTKPAANYTPPLTIGSYAWVDDPDESNKAYRCNIRAMRGDGDAREADIYIYEDSNNPTPVTVAMAADHGRHVTVPWTTLNAALKLGRGGYPYYVPVTPVTIAAVGEVIASTPIPTAGPISINTPDAASVLAASVAKNEAPPASAPATAPAKPRRPGRPSAKAAASSVKTVEAVEAVEAATEQMLPEGARQTTIDDVDTVIDIDVTRLGARVDTDATQRILSQLNARMEVAALEGVLSYIEARLAQLKAQV